MNKYHESNFLSFLADRIQEEDIEKLKEAYLFYDHPFPGGVLSKRLLIPLESKEFPQSDYYEYIFVISEDMEYILDEANHISTALFTYIVALFVYCETKHESGVFYSGRILLMYISQIITRHHEQEEFVKMLYEFIDELYGWSKDSHENILDFKINDETLILAMHYFSTLINRNDFFSKEGLEDTINGKIDEMEDIEKNVIWCDDEIHRLIGSISRQLKNRKKKLGTGDKYNIGF